MDRPLGPLPNWKTRWVVFVVLILPAFLAGGSWGLKLFAIAFVAAMVGTVQEWRVSGTELVSQQFIAFIPLKPKRCKLKFVVEIEVQNRRGLGTVDWLIFGIFILVIDRVMQWVWPWFGGELEMWVVTARDKKMLAWRGNGDAAFQANLATLTSATGANVRRQ